MVAWPGSLPQKPNIQGYSEEEPEGAVRTDMDVGPAKVRRRTTAAPSKTEWPFLLTTAQRTALSTFFRTTLAYGTTTFTHTHPVTGAAITLRFLEPPKYTPVSHDTWRTTLSLEILAS